jgi:hypothetical protein
MKKLFYGTVICISTLLCGILLFLYHKEWIIVRNPFKEPTEHVQSLHKKRCPLSLFYWKYDQWHTESTWLVWSDDIQEVTMSIINAWLQLAYEEHIIVQQISTHTLFEKQARCLYISCNNCPFDTNMPLLNTLIIIESLLYTLDVALPNTIAHVYVLVEHVPMAHPHLDCTMPFPMQGFGILKKP